MYSEFYFPNNLSDLEPKLEFRARSKSLNRTLTEICGKAKELYLPNGFLKFIPKEWNCDLDFKGKNL